VAVAVALAPAMAQERGLDFSGVQRTRYESLTGQILAGLDERDEVLALQTSLLFDFRLDRLHFVGEILDSRAELNDPGSFINSTVVNVLEPLQAYVAWTGADTEQRSAGTLRFGRLTLDLGKRRVMSRNRFRNTVNNFVGADWQRANAGGGNLRAFYLVPMRHLPADQASLLGNEFELDRGVRDTAVRGVFYGLPELPGGHFIEAYVLDYEADARDPESSADLVSMGARSHRLPQSGRWSYEVELIAQSGESGADVEGVPRFDLQHDARFAHFEIGYTFDRAWSPTITLQYDRASGDENPFDDRNERFNTLFGDRRFDFGPTGIFGPFQRSNLETPGVRVAVSPSSRWQGMLSLRSLRLASSTDEWVGTDLRDASGAAGSSLGTQLEASATWAAIPGRLSLDVGFAALELGRFARQTLEARQPADPQPNDPRYWYAAITTTF
jgi:hypothetical protein